MAFTSKQNNADRTRTAIVVTLLQAAAIYGLVAGLAGVITRPAPPVTEASNIPLTPPPKPSPTPKDSYSPALPSPLPTLTLPLDPIQPSPSPSSVASSVPSGTPSGTGTTLLPSPSPSASPLFRPKGAVPRGRPGEWVNQIDYPSQDLREGNQGVVRLRLEITAQGKVTNCTVTATSGFPRLDAAACAKLIQRAKFDPASDENGAKVASQWSTSVRWTIPTD